MHHVIESLTVTGATHFRDATFDFRDRLNFLIGGRGTGKSGIEILIRFALGSPVPEDYIEEMDEYVRATLGVGQVCVRIRTAHGARYTSTRSYGHDPVVRSEDGELAHVTLDGELFQLDAYAQNEIEGIAKDAAAQLTLIDKFADAEIRRVHDLVAQLERRLFENAATRRRLDGEIAEDAAREGELASVAEALKGVDLGGAGAGAVPQERQKAHEAKVQRGRERATMAAQSAELEAVRVALDVFARDALQRLSRAVDGDLERGPHAEIFREVHTLLQRLGGALEGSAGRLRSELASAAASAAEQARELAAAHAKEDEVYNALVVRDDADRERATESERLHRRFTELSAVAKRLGDRRREDGAARNEGAALLAERARLLAEKSAHRARVCDDISRAHEDEIRAQIIPGGNSAPCAKILGEILRGANIRPVSFIASIAERIRPVDLVAMARRNELAPLMAIDPVKTGREERASKILGLLRASDRLHELELARPEDAPILELKVGNDWRPSNRLSTGQRCSCILPILLLQSAAPLLVDQAEDNLDNAFIFDVLVKRLATAKEGRQLIVATHNPNPVTLTDADRILVLAADEEGRGTLAAAGTFKEVKVHVERLLEGGRKAFRMRGERYGHFAEGEEDEEEKK